MELENLIKHYLDSNPILVTDYKVKEFEIRFGSNAKLARPLNQVDYENVVKQLLSCGFHSENKDGSQLLRITNEFVDKNTGMTRLSNVRCELVGSDVIQNYCKHNSIQQLLDSQSTITNQIQFTQKMNFKVDDTILTPVDVRSFNFRASFQSEQSFSPNSNFIKNIITDWSNSKKVFRLLNRVRFSHPILPLFVDVTIVKSSLKENRRYVPMYTIQESKVFENTSTYEVEIELDNKRVGYNTPFANPKELLASIRKAVRIVMTGIQKTKYPISYDEQEKIVDSYLSIIHDKNHGIERITGKHFIGPSTLTLQMENISEANEHNTVPTIRNDYCVTDKADGERRLLYIHSDGKIYMIDTNMQIIFTGAISQEKTIYNTILDGEFIYKNKLGEIVNLYAAFDIYFAKTKDVRTTPFVSTENSRLKYLQHVISVLKPVSIISERNKNLPSPIRIQAKSFYVSDENVSIFSCCSKILSNEDDGLLEYNTDGLIFTPNKLPVGADKDTDKPSNFRTTWQHSFKWKPPEFNTIDFLVSVKKDVNNQDEVHHVYQDGVNVKKQSLIQYKTLILRCGYDEKLHGLINPCEMILQGDLHKTPGHKLSDETPDNKSYKPVPFVPSNPYQEDAYLCNISLVQRGSHSVLMTSEDEPFEENMIVEFQYIKDREPGWNWVPLRVRYDKTAELRNGMSNYGNAYHVANNNWKSIHYPIDKNMIRSGNNIPEQNTNEDIYYNRLPAHKSHTRCLRDFHNLFVKYHLIKSVATRKSTLIDYSVGKAGDLSKWHYSGISFVYGIDVSRDNIHNAVDGACARYINKYRKSNQMFGAIFNIANSSLNIMDGSAFNSDKEKSINQAIFGKGPKANLGDGLLKHYGVGSQGFDVGSCQFSLHYFFETPKTLHNFVRNLSETIKDNGYFIGTCYDGNSVFRLLSDKSNGEMVSLYHHSHKIFEIIKRYSDNEFPSDEDSIGYAIDVYQDTINQYFREYLVNFPYFTQVMEQYGFILLTPEEMGGSVLPHSTGLFSDLFHILESSPDSHSGCALNMSDNEKQISFLNRYFIFKKVRTVDTVAIMKHALSDDTFTLVVKTDDDKTTDDKTDDNKKDN